MKKAKKYLQELLKKYSANTCSEEEFNEFCNILHEREQHQVLHQVLKEKWDATGQVAFKKQRNIYYWTSGVAAAVIIVLVSLFFFRNTSNDITNQPVASNEAITNETVSRIVLSDGSTVMLREGSRLTQSGQFDGKTREVSLEGEAFFDIASNPEKPFIIHTGKIKTTVLGTAFSIKSLPNEPVVVVTVTRGKVKVEDEKKILAVLEADKQFVYDMTTKRTEEKTVNANKETSWKAHDLLFKNKSFAAIVQELSRIYEVDIMFETDTLKNKLITASIDDREPIEQVLNMLCVSQHAYYIYEDGIYKIKALK